MTRRMNHQLFRRPTSYLTENTACFHLGYEFICDHTVWDFCSSLTKIGKSRYTLVKIPPMPTDGLTDGHDKVGSRCVSCVRAENKTKQNCDVFSLIHAICYPDQQICYHSNSKCHSPTALQSRNQCIMSTSGPVCWKALRVFDDWVA
jgi:hypothetical protein